MKDGNLTYDGTYKYTYDHQNRLVKATRADTDVVVQTAAFDGLGRRIKKIVTNSGDLDGTTVYHHDGNQIIETRDGSNNVTMQVYHGTQYIDEVVGLRLEHGRVYVHQAEGDQSGRLKDWNVTGVTDLTGRLLERNYYSPYGEPETTVETHFFDYDDDGDVDDVDIAAGTSTGVCWCSYSGDCKRLDADADRDIDAVDYAVIAAFADALSSDGEIQRVPAATESRLRDPFGHQGLANEPEFGGYHVRRRSHLLIAMRFTQRDPLVLTAAPRIAYFDGMSVYQFARGNPVRWRDPTGLACIRGSTKSSVEARACETYPWQCPKWEQCTSCRYCPCGHNWVEWARPCSVCIFDPPGPVAPPCPPGGPTLPPWSCCQMVDNPEGGFCYDCCLDISTFPVVPPYWQIWIQACLEGCPNDGVPE